MSRRRTGGEEQGPATETEPVLLSRLEPVNGQEILAKLADLPISSWSYRWEDPGTVRHLGPMAQDFAAAFGLGDDDRKIDHVDANGVVMVAIQALHRRVEALEATVAGLRERLDDGVERG